MFSFVSFTNVLSWRGVSFWRVMEEALPDSPATSQPNIRLGLILKEPLWQAAVCALVAFAVYLRTLAPTVMWYDMGEFATAAYVLGIAHNTGYPLYILLGKLFTFLPVGDIAYRVNLMSAFFAAVTVLLMYLMVYRLTQRRGPALLSALTLAFTSTLWSNATWAESYDLNAFLTLLIIDLMLLWRSSGRGWLLDAASLTLGLSLGNHRLILVTVPAMAYLAWDRLRRGGVNRSRRRWLATGLFFVLGFAVNLYLPLRAAQHPALNWGDPSDLGRFLTMITTGYGRGFLNPFESTGRLSFWVALLILFPAHEFTIPGLFLAAAGSIVLLRRDRGLFVATLLVCLASASLIAVYGIHNIFNYFQPIYLMLAIWLGFGADLIVRLAGAAQARIREGRLGFLTPDRFSLLATILLLGIPISLLRGNFAQLDRSERREAADFAEYVLGRYGSGTEILADFWSWTPVEYATVVAGKSSGVRVSSALSVPELDKDVLIDGFLEAGRDVYLSVSSEDSPHLETGSHRLQLVAPYVIQFYPTHAVPLPAFKDMLVPKGGIYRVVSEIPDLTVDQVPSSDQRSADFGGTVLLRGFHLNRTRVARGEAFQATYYWSLAQSTDTDYWVDVLFTDAAGNVATQNGIPLWLHSHWLGGGVSPTSEWTPGSLVREVYDGLVPRLVAPGSYIIRAFVYTDPSRSTPLPLEDSSFPGVGAILGVVVVR